MKRCTILMTIVFLLSAAPGWAKWSKDQQEYLDSSFTDLQQKFAAMKAQVASLEKTLADVKDAQAEMKAAISQQQQALQEMKQLVLSLQLAQTESSTNVNSALAESRSENQRSFAALSAALSSIEAAEQKLLSVPGPQAPATATSASALAPAPAPATPLSGFITAKNGDEITISLGSSAGLHVGSRLDLFKPKDPSARVGVLEVTDVIDAGDAHVRVISISPGVTPEFSDIVRPE